MEDGSQSSVVSTDHPRLGVTALSSYRETDKMSRAPQLEGAGRTFRDENKGAFAIGLMLAGEVGESPGTFPRLQLEHKSSAR